MNKVNLAFEKTKKALLRFDEVVQMPLDAQRMIIDATIQWFEFSIELFWKLLKVLLASEGVETGTPKTVLQQAFIAQYIRDEKLWLAMLADRNETSHTYNEGLALTIYTHIKEQYNPLLQKTIKDIEKQITQ